MILTSNTEILNPVYNKEQTSALDKHLRAINNLMLSTRIKQARGKMHYNYVTKEAIKHRYAMNAIPEGRKGIKGENEFREYYTKEQKFGTYKVNPIGKIKANQFIQEYRQREFSCQVTSIDNQDLAFIPNYLLNQVYDTANFGEANNTAITDAVIKGTGVLRNRLYDTSVKTSINTFTGKKIKKTDAEVTKYKGLKVEYVDIDNVFIDPHTNNPQECFISTPMTDLEVISLLPQLKSLLNISYMGQPCDPKKDTDYIGKSTIPYYKMGEKMVEIYQFPELYAVMNNGVMAFPNQTFDSSGLSTQFLKTDVSNFSNWYNDILYNNSNILTQHKYNQSYYRLNEYYNWASNTYIMYIGDYILYQGEMFEPIIDNPLQPLYFTHDMSMGFFGESLFDIIDTKLVNINEIENHAMKSMIESSANILLVNKDSLEHPNVPIEVETTTFVPVKNTTRDAESARLPAIQQVPIANPTLTLLTQFEDREIGYVERVYPQTQSLNAQVSKDEIEYTLHARDMNVNYLLNLNAQALSKFAYKTFGCIIKELEYLRNLDLVIDTKVSKKVGIVVRQSQKDLDKAKVEVQKMLQDSYQKKYDMVKQSVGQSEEFQSQADYIRQTDLQSAQSSIKQLNEQTQQQPDADRLNQLNNMIQQQIQSQQQALLDKMVKDKLAQAGVQEPEDNNWYLSLDSLTNMLGMMQSFKFDFAKTKLELQKNFTNFVQLANSLPLSGMTFDYEALLRDMAISYGLNPDVIMKEVMSAPAMQSLLSTKMSIYADPKNYPNIAGLFAKVYQLDEKALTDTNSSYTKYVQSIMQTEADIQAKTATSGIAAQAQANILSNANNTNMKNQQQGADNSQFALPT